MTAILPFPTTERTGPYALVQDVLAGWEHYAPWGAAVRDPVPHGLLLHVAGPTLVGFRTIEVWESTEAWLRFARDRLQELLTELRVPALARDFDVREVVAHPGLADALRDRGELQCVIAAAKLVS